jgi:hypothetical protein
MRTMLAITLLLGLGWAQSLPTPQAVLNRLSQKAKTTRAYAYQWDYFKRDPNTGKLGAKQVYKLEFLKPHYRKLTIIQRDLFSNGAVLTYNPDQDSKVHARKGIIHRTYAPDDPEVADFFRTDLGMDCERPPAALQGCESRTCPAREIQQSRLFPCCLRPERRHLHARGAVAGGERFDAHSD